MSNNRRFIPPDLAAYYEWQILSDFDGACMAADNGGTDVPGVSNPGRRRINRLMLRRANAKFVAAVNAGTITADTTEDELVAALPATILWCIGRELLVWFLRRTFTAVFRRSIVTTTTEPPRPAA